MRGELHPGEKDPLGVVLGNKTDDATQFVGADPAAAGINHTQSKLEAERRNDDVFLGVGSDQLGEQSKPEPIRLVTGGRSGTGIGSETQNKAPEKGGKPK
jgi:hypothetical protein